MPTQPLLTFPGFDARWRVVKAEEARRAKVPSHPIPEGRQVCRVDVDDFWVTLEDGPWVIAYRLVLQSGRLVIGELRVYPRVLRDPDYEWSGVLPPWNSARDLQGVNAWAPPGGLTSTVVHRVRPNHDVNLGRLIVRAFRGPSADPARVSIWKHLLKIGVQTDAPPAPATAHHRGGALGKGIGHYKRAAEVYRQAPSRPVQAVAKALRISRVQARGVIYRARHHYGLLPSTSSGKANGADVAALQRIATDAETGRAKVPQVNIAQTENARQSPRRKRRA